MATWKERGMVPDSDDEEDGESQVSAYDEQGNGSLDVQRPRSPVVCKNDAIEDIVAAASPSPNVGALGTLKASPEAASYPLSQSPRAFKVPPMLSDFDNWTEEDTDPKNELPVVDDISHSYVTISSQSPNLASSQGLRQVLKTIQRKYTTVRLTPETPEIRLSLSRKRQRQWMMRK
jgi:hypothetical protein